MMKCMQTKRNTVVLTANLFMYANAAYQIVVRSNTGSYFILSLFQLERCH